MPLRPVIAQLRPAIHHRQRPARVRVIVAALGTVEHVAVEHHRIARLDIPAQYVEAAAIGLDVGHLRLTRRRHAIVGELRAFARGAHFAFRHGRRVVDHVPAVRAAHGLDRHPARRGIAAGPHPRHLVAAHLEERRVLVPGRRHDPSRLLVEHLVEHQLGALAFPSVAPPACAPGPCSMKRRSDGLPRLGNCPASVWPPPSSLSTRE